MSLNLLVVRVGRVGDTVMATPALTALLKVYPDAKITLLVSPVGKLLLTGFHPNIKDIWTWERSGIIKPISDKNNLKQQLKSSRFDKIICFDTSHHIANLFTGIDTEFYQHKGTDGHSHTAQAYLDLVATITGKDTTDIYNYLPVDNSEREKVDSELIEHGIKPDDKVLMIHPTFSGYSRFGIRKKEAKLRKLWSPENYGTLCKKIRQTHPEIKPMMVLLPDELSFGQKIVEHSDNSVLLLKSESTFERYKAMISRADVILSPDSGPMHIASALGTRIVAFFSMKDPENCGPFMAKSDFIIIRSEDTDHPELGINAIDVDTVYDACMKLLTNNDTAQ